MNDQNKLFTNILVYGLLIFVGVQAIRMINNVFIAHQKNQNLIYSKKVINNKYRSPSQNYINPYKECSYSKTNYEMYRYSRTSPRYCIDFKTNEITSVNNNEETRVLGKIGDQFQKEYFLWTGFL